MYALSAFVINFEQHSLHRALARCLLEPLGQLGFEAVDDYFGNFTARFGFENDTADVIFTKHAEDFLSEYNGAFNAKLKTQD